MDEDVKDTEETSEEDGVASEESQTTDESSEDTSEEDVETSEDDETEDAEDEDPYKSELDRVKERLGKKLDNAREKIKDLKQNSVSREEAERIADAAAEKAAARAEVRSTAARLAGGNESLRQLIIHHYENSIVPSGNVEEDMDNAFALATKKRVKAQISETQKANQSRKTRLGDSGAGAPLQRKSQQKYSQEILDGAAFAGVTPEEFVKKHPH